MIRRNTASQTIYFPQLMLAVDGSAITSSATLTVAKDGTEAASDGTLAHSANGVWKYTPTQSETDAAIVALILTAAGAVPVVLNLVTTAADTAAVAMGANTTAPDNAGIAAIKAKTDNLPASPAAVGSEMTLEDSAITAAKVAAAALDDKGNWNTTTPPTASAVASQVRTELTTELGRIDAAVSTRSTFAGGAVESVTNPVTAGTVTDKTGYSLSTAPPTVNEIQSGLATATELAKVIKTGEERTISRDGQDSITFTETRV